MGEAIIRNLKAKSRKPFEEWMALLETTTLKEKKEIIAFLKKENGLGHFQAPMGYEYFKGEDQYENPEAFGEAPFNTENTKALYQFSKARILALANGIQVQPCKTHIPFNWKQQFARITKTKDDKILLGLNLPESHPYANFHHTSSKGSERINAQNVLGEGIDIDQEFEAALLTE